MDNHCALSPRKIAMGWKNSPRRGIGILLAVLLPAGILLCAFSSADAQFKGGAMPGIKPRVGPKILVGPPRFGPLIKVPHEGPQGPRLDDDGPPPVVAADNPFLPGDVEPAAEPEPEPAVACQWCG